MIDNYLLEELVAFSEHKTLAAAAEYLNVTQPTLTRGMQKIENELQVTLFNRQKTVTFKELRGLSFLVANDIGTWKDIIQDYIPKAKFLYQENLAALSELTQYSSFPVFRTNLSSIRINDDKNDGRRLIPISDEEATVEVYACYLKNNRHDLQVIFDKVSEIFSKNLPN